MACSCLACRVRVWAMTLSPACHGVSARTSTVKAREREMLRVVSGLMGPCAMPVDASNTWLMKMARGAQVSRTSQVLPHETPANSTQYAGRLDDASISRDVFHASRIFRCHALPLTKRRWKIQSNEQPGWSKTECNSNQKH